MDGGKRTLPVININIETLFILSTTTLLDNEIILSSHPVFLHPPPLLQNQLSFDPFPAICPRTNAPLTLTYISTPNTAAVNLTPMTSAMNLIPSFPLNHLYNKNEETHQTPHTVRTISPAQIFPRR